MLLLLHHLCTNSSIKMKHRKSHSIFWWETWERQDRDRMRWS
jgi:hypothetical protein